jgi:hypothetical protein
LCLTAALIFADHLVTASAPTPVTGDHLKEIMSQCRVVFAQAQAPI